MNNEYCIHTNGLGTLLEWQKDDKKVVKRINDLIKSIDREGVLQGIGKPETLKYRKLIVEE